MTSLSKGAVISGSRVPIWGTMAAFWQVYNLATHYFYVYCVMVTVCFEKFNHSADLMFSVFDVGEMSKAVIASFL